MRATPTITTADVKYYSGSFDSPSSSSGSNIKSDGFSIDIQHSGQFTQYRAYPIEYAFSADAEL